GVALLVRTRLHDERVANRRRVHEDRGVVGRGGPVRVAAGGEPNLRTGALEGGGGDAAGTAAPEHERARSGGGDGRGDRGAIGVEAGDPTFGEDERVHGAGRLRELVELVAQLRRRALVRHGHV